jgi:hypothetical protein
MIQRGHHYHHPFLVGIDDATIEREYLPHFVAAGGASDVAGVRALCRAARAKGFDWVVPCGVPNKRGLCDCGRALDEAAQAVAEVP